MFPIYKYSIGKGEYFLFPSIDISKPRDSFLLPILPKVFK